MPLSNALAAEFLRLSAESRHDSAGRIDALRRRIDDLRNAVPHALPDLPDDLAERLTGLLSDL